MNEALSDNLKSKLFDDQVQNSPSYLCKSGEEMDLNSRKRKIESEESNDEDTISEESVSLKSSMEEDTRRTFGLKYDFLKSLGIRPPIEKWIYVCNFRCDKSELKEVLELAGHVIICAVFAKNGKSAKVMYSHPLEAVQAVSMLNGKTFYEQKLHVSMLNCPSDTIVLPKGLVNVGPGLGMHGRPLRDVARHYSKYRRNKISLIDHSLFHNPDDVKNEDTKEDCKSDNDTNAKPASDKKVEKDETSNEGPFKTANVEDLYVDSSIASESKMKKAKRDSKASSQVSSRESEDETSNTSNEEPKSSNTATPRKEANSEPASKPNNNNPNSNSDISRPKFAPANTRPQNVRPSMPFTSGSQMVPASARMGPCSQVIGPHPQARPTGPFGVPIRPSGPSVGPPMGPNHTSVGPQTGPIGHQPGPIGPPRVAGPTGPIARVSGPIVPMGPGRPPGPYPQQVPVGPFQPSGPMPNPNLGPCPMIDANVPGQHITLHFRNLPPTTTFPLLCEKVAQCGQVLSLQLTTPGCAVAGFAHRAHADRCFQFFNGKFIDGHVIEVRYA